MYGLHRVEVCTTSTSQLKAHEVRALDGDGPHSECHFPGVLEAAHEWGSLAFSKRTQNTINDFLPLWELSKPPRSLPVSIESGRRCGGVGFCVLKTSRLDISNASNFGKLIPRVECSFRLTGTGDNVTTRTRTSALSTRCATTALDSWFSGRGMIWERSGHALAKKKEATKENSKQAVPKVSGSQLRSKPDRAWTGPRPGPGPE